MSETKSAHAKSSGTFLFEQVEIYLKKIYDARNSSVPDVIFLAIIDEARSNITKVLNASSNNQYMNSVNEDFNNVLIIAIENDDLWLVTQILKTNIYINYINPVTHRTALDYALPRGNINIRVALERKGSLTAEQVLTRQPDALRTITPISRTYSDDWIPPPVEYMEDEGRGMGNGVPGVKRKPQRKRKRTRKRKRKRTRKRKRKRTRKRRHS